ncbi:carbohydrate binding domain-containing protein [Halobacillus sp. A1]|uniref:carbohydrate binding domain-containing protein n=1 Tax=Halobacillus sp. A1 TaxID=2880262 RepID=UPI0020A66CEC|nr:carbohydrate binding domain-containing protein [Halobacillus sp. A1]MCP3029841.1 carbohydrate binding domain-containing protein [Halobacillus sp. A1]
MRKILTVLLTFAVVFQVVSPSVLAKKDKGDDRVEYWEERGLLTGLNTKKSENAAMSYSEYTVLLGNLLNISSERVLEEVKDAGYVTRNENSAVKKAEAVKIFQYVLPDPWMSEVEEGTNKPLKRKDAMAMIDSLIQGYFYEKGTYEDEQIKGNAWINHSDVALIDSTIEGDLYISEGADPGNIQLENTTVSGTVYIDEKLQNKVQAIDSDLDNVVIVDRDQKESDWSLVWSDEFVSSKIDQSKWSHDTGNWIVDENGEGVSPGWGNNELQYYTDSSENSYIDDGKLVIEAKEEEKSDSFGSYDYTSAKLTSKGLFSQKYGKFEARMKLPEGQGFWPAFWMMPEDEVYGDWPVSGEIDIMEAAGKDTSEIGGTIHYGEEYPNNTYKGTEYHFPEREDYTDFHTYSVEWEPGEIRWYVDGELYQTLDNWFGKGENQSDKYAFPAPFDQEFYLIMNLAVGGWYGGNPDESTEFPGTMEVDYVRAYELTGREYKEPVEPVVEKDELPEDAKQPLEDGNLIYDNEYNEPFTIIDQQEDEFDENYWNLVQLPDFQGSGTIEKEELDGQSFAKTSVTDPGNALWSLQLIQKLAILEGNTYKVTFDAKSDTNRNIMTKVSGGEERGFANYSGEKTMELSDQVQSYEYTFTLNQDTDLGARIEFNMGSNGTAPVSIGNVRVENITGEQQENSTKPALADGNFIYNGTFDQGDMTRTSYWDLVTSEQSSAEMKVSEEQREMQLDIQSEGVNAEDVQVKQSGIPLAEGQDYELTFNARAEQNKTIEVGLISEDGSENYASEPVTLTEEMEDHTVEFTVPEAVSNGQLTFMVGGQSGDVYLDNVKMLQTSSEMDLYPLKNGDFSSGLGYWTEYIHFDAEANVSADEGVLNVDIQEGGNEDWGVLIEQQDLSLTNGITYVLSFDASSSVARDIEVTLENADYHRYFNETVSLNEEAQRFDFEFDMTADDQASLKFLMGNVSEEHNISIDDVVLEVKNASEYDDK